MKKLLLGTAVVGLAVAAAPAPASAQLALDLGGYFKGYGTYITQDDDAGAASEERNFDMIRDTEVHFTGETTLDNGLTVGVHVEAQTDSGDGFTVDESYAFLSGGWGRVNLGNEDGAAYLLQVAAPSADENFDGVRQFVNPFNYAVSSVPGATVYDVDGMDYDNDLTTGQDKFTYLSPVFNGFQAGVSYTPDIQDSFVGSASRTFGVATDEVADTYGEAYEASARYEGTFNNVGVAVGAGYTTVEEENDTAGSADEDFTEWNVGADFDIGPFGLGAVYTENDNGQTTLDENETYVVGVDYTTGPFKLGASYLNNQTDVAGAAAEVDADRYTGGVVYTYGPGMTFRGSVSYVDHEVEGVAADQDGTSVLLGTQINF